MLVKKQCDHLIYIEYIIKEIKLCATVENEICTNRKLLSRRLERTEKVNGSIGSVLLSQKYIYYITMMMTLLA